MRKNITVLIILGCVLIILFAAGCEKPETPNSATGISGKNQNLSLEFTFESITPYIDSLGNLSICYLAEFINPNDSAVRVQDISIDFYDTEENLICVGSFVRPHPEKANPGESIYIAETIIDDLLKDYTVDDISYAIVNYSISTCDSVRCPNIEISEPKMSSIANTTPKCIFTITNLENYDLENIDIYGPILDENGTIQGLFSHPESLGAGQSKGVEMATTEHIPDIDLANITVDLHVF